MSTYPVHSTTTAPDAARATLADTAARLGFVPNLFAVMAEAPTLLEAYRTIGALFDQTSLTPTERQVVLLTASYENDCEYCVAAHTAIAGMQRVSGEVVDAIRSGTPIADARLEALRRFTAAIVVNRGRDVTLAERQLFEVGYTASQALEIVVGIGMKTLSNYTNHLAATPLDPAFASAAWERVDR